MAFLDEFPWTWLSSAIWFIPVIVFFLRNAIFNKKEPAKSFTACDNPNCARCQKYHVTRTNAIEKFENYVTDSNFAELERIDRGLQNEVVKAELQNPNIFYLPDIKSQPWWNELLHDFVQLEKDVSAIENNFQNIFEEFEAIASSEEGWTFNSTETGKWSTFYLYNQGSQVSTNCDKCPKTIQTLTSLGLYMGQNLFGNALFSVVQPGTLITEHYGPCNLRVRCHLGLKVPKGCLLTVGKKSEKWEVGKCLLFDDSFLHKAEHNGQEGERVVLMLDLWHPEITVPERTVLDEIFKQY